MTTSDWSTTVNQRTTLYHDKESLVCYRAVFLFVCSSIESRMVPVYGHHCSWYSILLNKTQCKSIGLCVSTSSPSHSQVNIPKLCENEFV